MTETKKNQWLSKYFYILIIKIQFRYYKLVKKFVYKLMVQNKKEIHLGNEFLSIIRRYIIIN